MLSWLTKKLRTRAALVFAVLYASCVITPAIALAFTDKASAAHCLTDDHHGTGAGHMHGSMHIHDGSNVPGKANHDDKGMSDNCCGRRRNSAQDAHSASRSCGCRHDAHLVGFNHDSICVAACSCVSLYK